MGLFGQQTINFDQIFVTQTRSFDQISLTQRTYETFLDTQIHLCRGTGVGINHLRRNKKL